jgi:ribosomal protein S18 acetylase RimI-like enzyme
LSLTSWWEHFGGKDSVKNNPGKIARFDGLAVHPKYRGIGLGRKMVEESMKILKANGFQKVVVDATGFYSAGLFKKMGFRVVKEFPYATLEVDGKKLFTKMEPPHFALTMLEQDL